MPHLTPTSRRLVLSAACAASLIAVVGCKDEPKTPAAPAAVSSTAPADKTYAHAGLTFACPADWKVEPAPDGKAVSVVAPAADGGWEPGVRFEVVDDPPPAELSDLLDANIDFLRGRKQDFILKGPKREMDHPGGFRYGRVEYTNTDDISGRNTPLTQLSVLAPLPDKRRRLQVQAAAASSTWEKYVPTFDKIVDSVRVVK